MKLRYLSPSRLNTYNMCQYAYHLSYDYGMKGFNNSGALKGTICHEVIEILANLCRKEKKKSLRNKIISGYIPVLKKIWEKHNIDEHVVLGNEDKKDCNELLKKVLYDKNAKYFERKIIGVEKKFDFIIDKNGYLLESDTSDKAKALGLDDFTYFEAFYGELEAFRVCGVIDLVSELNKKEIEIIDWKTGKTTKKYEDLKKDSQVKIYNMVARKLFPQYDNYLMTMYYVRKVPVALVLSNEEILDTSAMLERKWREIRETKKPQRTISPINKWKCNFCAFKRDLDDFGACKKDCDIFYERERHGEDMTKYTEAANKGIRLEEIDGS